jgi:hypothetical protein
MPIRWITTVKPKNGGWLNCYRPLNPVVSSSLSAVGTESHKWRRNHMVAQTANFWQSVRRALNGSVPSQDNTTQQVTILESDAYTLPRNIQKIRVLAGGAWISLAAEDMILAKGETLTFRADRDGVVVTAVGHKPLQLELLV